MAVLKFNTESVDYVGMALTCHLALKINGSELSNAAVLSPF